MVIFKKANKHVQVKLVILHSIRKIAIKSKETRLITAVPTPADVLVGF